MIRFIKFFGGQTVIDQGVFTYYDKEGKSMIVAEEFHFTCLKQCSNFEFKTDMDKKFWHYNTFVDRKMTYKSYVEKFGIVIQEAKVVQGPSLVEIEVQEAQLVEVLEEKPILAEGSKQEEDKPLLIGGGRVGALALTSEPEYDSKLCDVLFDFQISSYNEFQKKRYDVDFYLRDLDVIGNDQIDFETGSIYNNFEKLVPSYFRVAGEIQNYESKRLSLKLLMGVGDVLSLQEAREKYNEHVIKDSPKVRKVEVSKEKMNEFSIVIDIDELLDEFNIRDFYDFPSYMCSSSYQEKPLMPIWCKVWFEAIEETQFDYVLDFFLGFRKEVKVVRSLELPKGEKIIWSFTEDDISKPVGVNYGTDYYYQKFNVVYDIENYVFEIGIKKDDKQELFSPKVKRKRSSTLLEGQLPKFDCVSDDEQLDGFFSISQPYFEMKDPLIPKQDYDKNKYEYYDDNYENRNDVN